MKFFRNHWYDLGLIPITITSIFLAFHWQTVDLLQKLALLNFVVIFAHQFEEYHFPGGEPAITNLSLDAKEESNADRYPLNQNNAMIMNVVASFTLYLFPVFFPHILWLSFTPILFGMSQLIIHVLKTPKKIGHNFYSPGACAVVFGHLPIGICWFSYTIATRQLIWLDVTLGLLFLALFIGGFMLKIGYGLLKSPTSPYAFPEKEFERGGYAKRIRQLKNSLPTHTLE